jgi:hypothetical protein
MPSDVTLPDGSVLQGVPEGTTQTQLIEKLKAGNNPNWKTMAESVTQNDDYSLLNFLDHTITEPIAALTTGIAGTVAGGVAGAAAGAYDAVAHGTNGVDKAADVMEKVQGAMTYQPKSEGGKAVLNAATYLPRKLDELAKAGGEGTLKMTGSPLAATVVETGIDFLPNLLTDGIGAAFRSADAAAEAAAQSAGAAARAAHYVETHTSLKWGDLSASAKAMMTSIATDAQDLNELSPMAVERRLRAASHQKPVPITKGEAERDPAAMKREQMARGTTSGRPLYEISMDQDEALHANVEALRTNTGPKTNTQTGASVQGRLRRKAQVLEGQAKRLYREADAAGETALPVNIKPLIEWFKASPLAQSDLKWLPGELKIFSEKASAPEGQPAIVLPDKFGTFANPEELTKIAESGKITITNLERVRQMLNRSSDAPNKYVVGEAISQIDQILDRSGGNLYRQSRAALKAYHDEFDRQGAIRKMTGTKPGTLRDRETALEDTFETAVVRGNAEGLMQVRDALLKGGTDQTRVAGAKAWRDLQSAAVDYLKEAAGGKRGIKNARDQGQFGSMFLDKFNQLDNDGKLDVLFGTESAKALRSLAQTVNDVRTTPSLRATGSDTVSNMLNIAESSISPVIHAAVGPVAGATSKGVFANLRARRTVKEATKDPLKSAAQKNQPKQRPSLAPKRAAAGAFTVVGANPDLGQAPDMGIE